MELPALPDSPSPEGAAAPKASLVVSPALPLPSYARPWALAATWSSAEHGTPSAHPSRDRGSEQSTAS